MSKQIIPLTAERLRELLHYNPETGVFTWLRRQGRVLPGQQAGNKKTNGYRELRVCGVRYHAHRLAWFYVTGSWPTAQIDHRNGIRDDNRLTNLRDVSPGCNNQNQRSASKNSKTGVLGVSLHKSGRYIAFICLNRKTRYLGLYPTAELAQAAYVQAKHTMHPGWTL